MTDHELLAAAYKAYRPGENYVRLVNDAGRDYWNPLTDDGAALRLAVKLELNVMVGVVRAPNGFTAIEYSDTLDENELTRRAIVRAAAAIGSAA